MELLLVGVSHKSGALDALERLAAIGAAEALRQVREAGWHEVVILSTCNRFEVYTVGARAKDLTRLVALLNGWAKTALAGRAYRHVGAEAVKHLFAVASGLESLVVGEAEILGQVKKAYESAQAMATTGKILNVLFQRALFVGKLVRSKTGISSGQLSVASVAVAMAERIFGDLKDSSVLVLGAGEMAELTAKHLLSAKVGKLRFANRTWERGVELAAKFKAEAVRWEDFSRFLETVDIVISSTGSVRPVITREMLAQAAYARRGRSLFVIDIGMPRDEEPSAQDLDQVYLYALEDLLGIIKENLAHRSQEIEAAENLVRTKTSEFEAWLAAAVAGTQAALRHSARNAPEGSSTP